MAIQNVSTVYIAEQAIPHLKDCPDELVQVQAIKSAIRFFLDTDIMQTIQILKKETINKNLNNNNNDVKTKAWVLTHVGYNLAQVIYMYTGKYEDIKCRLPTSAFSQILQYDEFKSAILVMPEFNCYDQVAVRYSLCPLRPTEKSKITGNWESTFPKSIADKYEDIIIARLCADLIGYVKVDNHWEMKYREGLVRVMNEQSRNTRTPPPKMMGMNDPYETRPDENRFHLPNRLPKGTRERYVLKKDA